MGTVRYNGTASYNSSVYKPYIIVTDTQDIPNNRSLISVTFGVNNKTNSTYWDSRPATYPFSINIAGNVSSGSSVAVMNSGDNVIASHSAYVSHNANGTLSLSVSASMTAPASGYSFGTASASASFSVPTIPRASSIAATRANIGEGTTITINSASSGFRHNVSYTFGGLSGTVTTSRAGGTFVWTVPTSFYSQIPNAATGTCTLRCDTYSGSTKIGSTASTTFVAAVGVNPSVDFTAIDINSTTVALTGDNTKFINDASTAQVTMTGSATPSASVQEYKATIGGVSDKGNPAVITFAKWGDSGISSGKITATLTDSRGKAASREKTVSVVDYFRCGFQSLSVKRENQTSNNVLVTFHGIFWNKSFGSVQNTLTVKVRYKERGAATWGNWINLTATISENSFSGQGTISPLDYQKDWDVEVQALDVLNVDARTQVLPHGIPLLQYSNGKMNVNGSLCVNSHLLSTRDGILELLEFNKQLWSGTWDGGTITLPGGAKYNMFRVHLKGQGTVIYVSCTATFFRGIGGYMSASPTVISYQVAATASRNGEDMSLTYIASGGIQHRSGTTHNTAEFYPVSEIWGLF